MQVGLSWSSPTVKSSFEVGILWASGIWIDSTVPRDFGLGLVAILGRRIQGWVWGRGYLARVFPRRTGYLTLEIFFCFRIRTGVMPVD